MNPGDLESELPRRTLRPIPPEWRDDILNAARRAASRQPSGPRPRPAPWWRELLWPCPQAWAGLAAAWVMIWLFNSAIHRPVSAARHDAAPVSPEVRQVLREQKHLFAELLGHPPATEPRPNFFPRPRSELPRHFSAA